MADHPHAAVPPAPLPRRTLALYLFLFWTVIGLRAAITAHMELRERGEILPFWEPLVWEMSSHWVIAALTPCVWWMVRHAPFSKADWPARLAQHAAALLVFSALHTSLMVLLRMLAYRAAGSEYDFGYLPYEAFYELLKDITLYVLLVALAYGYEFYQRFRARSIDAARLETLLARARLDQLEAQLHPHFLYNTLNTVSSVMYQDVQSADRMLSRLGTLLRAALEKGPPQVPLDAELRFLESYLDIMRMRFSDRLDVRVDVAAGARDALVPRFILQPIVENAIKHAVAPNPAGGRVDVSARVEGGRLRMTVRDDGPGMQPAASPSEGGVGLANTSERLAHLYGSAARLEATNGDRGGLVVAIDLPYRNAALEATV